VFTVFFRQIHGIFVPVPAEAGRDGPLPCPPFRQDIKSRPLKKWFSPGCSKMPRCKAPEILRSEAYWHVRCNDEGPAESRGNAADGRFSAS